MPLKCLSERARKRFTSVSRVTLDARSTAALIGAPVLVRMGATDSSTVTHLARAKVRVVRATVRAARVRARLRLRARVGVRGGATVRAGDPPPHARSRLLGGKDRL